MLVVGLVRFQLMISGNAANVAGKAAVSTTLAASRGGITATFLSKMMLGYYNIGISRRSFRPRGFKARFSRPPGGSSEPWRPPKRCENAKFRSQVSNLILPPPREAPGNLKTWFLDEPNAVWCIHTCASI